MKKILSIALAVVMLFAVCVPAFAANPITQDTEPNGTTIVKTSTTTETGEDAEKYAVTIPAETIIPWEKTVTALEGYSVEAHLAYGKHVYITVAGSGLMKLADDAAETLAYTLSGDGVDAEYVSTTVVNPAAPLALNVTIEADAWANAIVGEYSDTLTFTASIV